MAEDDGRQRTTDDRGRRTAEDDNTPATLGVYCGLGLEEGQMLFAGYVYKTLHARRRGN